MQLVRTGGTNRCVKLLTCNCCPVHMQHPQSACLTVNSPLTPAALRMDVAALMALGYTPACMTSG